MNEREQPNENTCRSCGEPLKATATISKGELAAFAITPNGWSGPLIFTAFRHRTACGLTTAHGGGVLHIGINLHLDGDRIVQDANGSLTDEQWDHLMGELLLLANGADVKLPWFESLLHNRQWAADCVKQEALGVGG